jgi:hypothetical protein
MAVFLTVPENTMRKMTDAPKVSPTEHAGLHPSTHARLFQQYRGLCITRWGSFP